MIGESPTRPGIFQASPLVVGVEVNGAAAAYPLAALADGNPLNALVGGTPIVLVVGPERNSVRSFSRRIDGQVLEFYRRAEDGALIDSAGGVWSFAGRATAGPLAGRSLEPLQNRKEYWFDWQRYHPSSTLRWRGLSPL